MRQALTALLFAWGFCCQAGAAPGLGWTWAFAGDVQTTAEIYALNSAADGSTCLAGTFYEDIAFGSLQLTAPDPYMIRAAQGFVAKVDAAGRPLWATKVTATNSIVPLAVAVDGAGGCFVGGGFTDYAVLVGYSLTSSNHASPFVARLTSTGTVAWAKSLSATSDSWVSSAWPAPGGGLYIGGAFSGQLSFGIKTLTNQPAGEQNGFVAKLDSAGNVLWVHRTGGAVNSVAASPAGAIYAAGAFCGPTANFENQTITITNAEARYAAHFLSDGTPDWIYYFGSDATPSQNTAAGVVAAGDEKVWLTGTYTGGTSIGGHVYTSAGMEDIAFVKLSSTGAVIMSGSIGGPGTDVVQAEAIYGSGTYGSNNLVLAGSFSSQLTFGTNTLTANGLDGVSAFVLMADSNGAPVLLAGPSDVTELASANAVAVGPSGMIVGGLLEGYGTFGSTTVGATTPGVYDVYNYFLAQFAEPNIDHQFPGSHPLSYGSLAVWITPTNGQWRLPWDVSWRNSGQTVSNLAVGNYTIEFRNISGYLPIPPSLTLPVTAGATVMITNQYYPTLALAATGVGALTVNIGPNAPAGAGWRFLGDTIWRLPGTSATNLAPDTYFIEFEPVSNYSPPGSRAAQVYANQTTLVSVNYSVAQSRPTGIALPTPVPVNNISDITNYPFGFNGQLLTDVGYGSGVAAQANVALSAAHLVFNDQTLSYASQAYWYFQQELGLFAPEPLSARGWYVLSGYAAQRTNDLPPVGGLAPDVSSPQSRNMDVAALYFLSPVAAGGYGGYLSSDAAPNPWLSGTAQKMLVGYPVDGSLFGDASITNGVMYQTGPQSNPLTLATNAVPNQQVYVGSWFLSYPGNSGGPLYVQYNGYSYPAAVYLGTLFNGNVPYASAVRAIDSNVVNLVTLAATRGDSGTNNTGGGVLTIIPSPNISPTNAGYIQWLLAPPAAVQAGAAWRLQGDPTFSSASNYVRAVTSTNRVFVEFKPLAGWNLPTNQAANVLPGQITAGTAFYTVTNPVMTLKRGQGLSMTGTSNTVYRLERRSSLASNWVAVKTNSLTNGLNLLLPWPLTNGPSSFYRAVWLP